MDWGLTCRTQRWRTTSVLWLCYLLLYKAAANAEMYQSHITVTASHQRYICPEGASVQMVCHQSGAVHKNEAMRQVWLYNFHSDQHCSGHVGPRNLSLGGHNHTLPRGVRFGHAEQIFWMVLENVTHADQGRYCCAVGFRYSEHKHDKIVRFHSYSLLQVTSRKGGSHNCTFSSPVPVAGTIPVALAIAACILALLSLPLILLLVYKQRQNVHSSRRAQEMTRMDSEALGHENPVFLGGSPQTKTRTVSQIMTRQSSETGRHLLSEPGTPLSPPAHGDVFFPIEDVILESP